MHKEILKYLLTNIQLFAEGDETNPAQDENPNNAYIDTIKQLKENTVPKEEYEKLVAERARLLKSVIDGDPIEGERGAEQESAPDVDTLRREILNVDVSMTNLEYVTKVLKMRDAIIKEKGPDADPFLPPYANLGERHTSEEIAKDQENAEAVASFLENTVEQAHGDPEVFNSLLNIGLVDDPKIAMQSRAQKAARKGK